MSAPPGSKPAGSISHNGKAIPIYSKPLNDGTGRVGIYDGNGTRYRIIPGNTSPQHGHTTNNASNSNGGRLPNHSLTASTAATGASTAVSHPKPLGPIVEAPPLATMPDGSTILHVPKVPHVYTAASVTVQDSKGTATLNKPTKVIVAHGIRSDANGQWILDDGSGRKVSDVITSYNKLHPNDPIKSALICNPTGNQVEGVVHVVGDKVQVGQYFDEGGIHVTAHPTFGTGTFTAAEAAETATGSKITAGTAARVLLPKAGGAATAVVGFLVDADATAADGRRIVNGRLQHFQYIKGNPQPQWVDDGPYNPKPYQSFVSTKVKYPPGSLPGGDKDTFLGSTYRMNSQGQPVAAKFYEDPHTGIVRLKDSNGTVYQTWQSRNQVPALRTSAVPSASTPSTVNPTRPSSPIPRPKTQTPFGPAPAPQPVRTLASVSAPSTPITRNVAGYRGASGANVKHLASGDSLTRTGSGAYVQGHYNPKTGKTSYFNVSVGSEKPPVSGGATSSPASPAASNPAQPVWRQNAGWHTSSSGLEERAGQNGNTIVRTTDKDGNGIYEVHHPDGSVTKGGTWDASQWPSGPTAPTGNSSLPTGGAADANPFSAMTGDPNQKP